MLELKCDCCGFEQAFADAEAAFRAGWDAPPYFTGYVSCNLCPGSFIVMGQKHLHTPEHERWKVTGRPQEFEIPRDENGAPIFSAPVRIK
jgi:hypothetical protein